jgi:DnaK suppressor protein
VKPSKKTGTSAKHTSAKKLSVKPAPIKLQPKPSGKKTIATAPKKPGGGPVAPYRPAPKPFAPLPRRRGGNVLSGPVKGFTPYQPKRGEEYMNKDQLEHFRQLLLAWKRELMEEVDRTMLHMKDDAANFPDPNDRATQESEFGLELRTRDRERKLLKKIDSALTRIDDGSYGYCEETGDEIGLRRLEARPVATLCVEAQERRELAERQFRDREDQYR